MGLLRSEIIACAMRTALSFFRKDFLILTHKLLVCRDEFVHVAASLAIVFDSHFLELEHASCNDEGMSHPDCLRPADMGGEMGRLCRRARRCRVTSGFVR